MKQEDKELLLKDLCSRLPYEVKIKFVPNETIKDIIYVIDGEYSYIPSNYTILNEENIKYLFNGYWKEYKPYLFPLSSMTEEQKQYLKNRFCYDWDGEPYELWKYQIEIGDADELIDWFHENHIDYRCLIPKGLALDASGLNIY